MEICPCCVPTFVLMQFLFVALVFYVSTSMISREKSRLIKVLIYVMNTLIFLLICACIALTQSDAFRSWVFSRLFFLITDINKVDPVRCDLMKNLRYRFYIIHRHSIHTYIHTCIQAYIHKYIHTYIHMYIHTCLHAYIHTEFTNLLNMNR